VGLATHGVLPKGFSDVPTSHSPFLSFPGADDVPFFLLFPPRVARIAFRNTTMNHEQNQVVKTHTLGLIQSNLDGPFALISQIIVACKENITGVRLGPQQTVEHFLDIEKVRLRISKELTGLTFEGLEQTVNNLMMLPHDMTITYVILELDSQQVQCFIDINNSQIFGLILFPIRTNNGSGEK
jgi:hypothetical protein